MRVDNAYGPDAGSHGIGDRLLTALQAGEEEGVPAIYLAYLVLDDCTFDSAKALATSKGQILAAVGLYSHTLHELSQH